MADDREELPSPSAGTGRMEAFSDGVFAIAITLLVLDLAIGDAGGALRRVADAWPFYLAYLVSFLTIGAAWLAHNAITNRLVRADSVLLRLNLLLLFVVSFLPFPTRLVAAGINDADGERVYVAMYGLTLLVLRLLLLALDEYARREQCYAARPTGENDARHAIVPVTIAYGAAILIGLALPVVAVALYCMLALYLVIPLRELGRLFLHRP